MTLQVKLAVKVDEKGNVTRIRAIDLGNRRFRLTTQGDSYCLEAGLPSKENPFWVEANDISCAFHDDEIEAVIELFQSAVHSK